MSQSIDNRGILYGVGVGPGDPELLTLKAVRIINEADVIALPKTDEQYITALEIVRSAVNVSQKEVLELYLPMTRNRVILSGSHQIAANEIAEKLRAGKKIAFLTLGDPSIYSTYIYIHNRILQEGFHAELIAGVPSFCAVAAKLNKPLCQGSEVLHIIPASYSDHEDYLDWSGTKILMKSGKSLTKLIDSLEEKGLLEDASMVERCGMSGENVYHDLTKVASNTSYFSTIVVREKEKNA